MKAQTYYSIEEAAKKMALSATTLKKYLKLFGQAFEGMLKEEEDSLSVNDQAIERFKTIRDLLSRKYSEADKLINDDAYRNVYLEGVARLTKKEIEQKKETKKKTPWGNILGILGLGAADYLIIKQEIKDAYPSDELEAIEALAIESLTEEFKAFKEEVNRRFTQDSLEKRIADLWNTHSFEMIRVEGGTFWMGDDEGDSSEKPVHQVRLSDYYIGKYPVTQAQWEMVMRSHPRRFKRCDQCAVAQVSWNEVQEFLEKLNARFRGSNYRLPTEAEWEYAARGGQLSERYIYAGSNSIEEVGWYSKKPRGRTHPVGKKKPNELGIYDMTGNVWEMCQDWYSKDYYQECHARGIIENPQGPQKASANKVVRGGSWRNSDYHSRVYSRNNFNPNLRSDSKGFRLCRSQPL